MICMYLRKQEKIPIDLSILLGKDRLKAAESLLLLSKPAAQQYESLWIDFLVFSKLKLSIHSHKIFVYTKDMDVAFKCLLS